MIIILKRKNITKNASKFNSIFFLLFLFTKMSYLTQFFHNNALKHV